MSILVIRWRWKW